MDVQPGGSGSWILLNQEVSHRTILITLSYRIKLCEVQSYPLHLKTNKVTSAPASIPRSLRPRLAISNAATMITMVFARTTSTSTSMAPIHMAWLGPETSAQTSSLGFSKLHLTRTGPPLRSCTSMPRNARSKPKLMSRPMQLNLTWDAL